MPTITETWVGCAKGKYQWDEETAKQVTDDFHPKDADIDIHGEAITKYSWSDGQKEVSLYFQLEGLDDVADGAISCDWREDEVSMTIRSLCGHRRRFAMYGLAHDIKGVRVVQKKGKNTVVLKLVKSEEKPWHSLQGDNGRHWR